jgi:uncharacterized coiled-coil protein SlyX
MDETTTVVSSVAGGGVVAWLVQRVLHSPDKVTELEKRVIRIESRIGSEGDVGTIMHVLTEMQQTARETQQMLRDILTRLSQ